MKFIVGVVFLVCNPALPAPAGNSQVSPPALPYVERNVCPGEGCQYGTWKAAAPTALYSSWSSEITPVAHLPKGEVVKGLRGVVVTRRPGTIRMDTDIASRQLSKGDVLLTYTNRGEGIARVWIHGRLEPSYDIAFAKHQDGSGCSGLVCQATFINEGDQTWWAQVRLASGKTGWVNMTDSRFDGSCTLNRGTPGR